jgi:TP901 family phage tail tape measure protein
MANLMSQNIIEIQARSVGIKQTADETRKLTESLKLAGVETQKNLDLLSVQTSTIKSSAGAVDKYSFVWKGHGREVQKVTALYDRLTNKIINAKNTTSVGLNDAITNRLAVPQGQIVPLSSQSFTNFGGVVSRNAKQLIDVLGVVGQKGVQFNTIWKGLDGTFNQTQTTFIRTAQGLKFVEGSLNTTKVSASNLGKEVKQGQSLTAGWVESFKRVAIVVPVWMAARAVIQGIIGTIRDGLQELINFEKQMFLATATLDKGIESISDNQKKLREEIRNLSQTTGIEMDKLAQTFYQFSEAGNSFEVSLGGMKASASLSLATLTDVNKIGHTLSGTYLLLSDSMDKTKTPLENMMLMGAQWNKIWQSNRFDTEQMIQTLERILPAGKAARMSYGELLSLAGAVNSAGLQASRGGTLLRSTIDKLLVSIPKISQSLNMAIDPNTERPFETLIRVIEKLRSIGAGGLGGETIQKLSEIFPDARTTQVMEALIGLLPLLKKNLKDTFSESGTMIRELNDQQEKYINSIPGQMERISTLRKQVGMGFLAGLGGQLGGTEDTVSTLQTAARTMKGFADYSNAAGKIVEVIANSIFTIPNFLSLAIDKTAKWEEKLMAVTVAGQQLQQTIWANEIKLGGKRVALNRELQIVLAPTADPEAVKKFYKELTKDGNDVALKKLELSGANPEIILDILSKKSQEATAQSEVNIKTDEQNKLLQTQNEELNSLSSKGKAAIVLKNEELTKIRQQIAGMSELEIAQVNLNKFLKDTVDQYKSATDAAGNHLNALTETQLQSLILNGQYKELKDIVQNTVDIEKVSAEVIKRTTDIEKIRLQVLNNMRNILLSSERELNEIIGASRLAILQRNLDVAKTDEEKLKARLEIEKAITKEKFGQASFTSREQKLYEIAQKHGIGAAKSVANVWSGGISTKEVRGSLSGTLFRQYFADEYKNRQMTEFFKTESGKSLLTPVKAESEDLKRVEQEIRKLQLKELKEIKENVKKLEDSLIKITPVPKKVVAPVNIVVDGKVVATTTVEYIDKDENLKNKLGKGLSKNIT